MAWRASRNFIRRARCLITLWCVLLSLAPANAAPHSLTFTAPAATAATATTVSLTPHLVDEDEKPNPVRRFFSWVIQEVTRPFRRRAQVGCSLPPIVIIEALNASITLPCPRTAATASTCSSASEVTLVANAPDPDQQLLFTWSVTAGRLRGEGRRVTWDLSGVPVGTYTATVEVNAGNQLTAVASTTVAVSSCKDCDNR